MRFSRILEIVYCTPWMILPEAHRSLGKLVMSVYEKDFLKVEDASRGINPFTRQALPEMRIQNGTAIIPVSGTMVRGADQIEKSCGFVDVEDVQRDMDEADASEEVRRIVLDIDSPGGMHNGATELAYRIAQSPKEVIAWTAGTMASAAYFIGSSADMLFASPSARVGSIGSYIAALDDSRAFEMQGLKMELFKSGEFKGIGTPGMPLTEAHRTFLQDIVDQSATQFKGHVKTMRPHAKEESMDGKWFYAEEAFSRGLVDGTANSMSALLKQLR